MNESETVSLEIVKPAEATALEAVSRAEVDVQIATAHRFPRSLALFNKRALEMVSQDEETAESCIYSRPVGGGKTAEGMSVRMAEIVGACYGNLRVGAMILEQTPRQVRARGMAHDLESNFASAAEVVESTVKKDGSPYDERMRVVVAKACLAKARRDAVFQVVPRALCKQLENTARKVAIGDASTLAKRRSAVMEWIKKLGIDTSRVFAVLYVSGEEDIGIDQLATLTGIKTAIKDGEISVDEAFPVVSKKPVFKETKEAKKTEQAPADPASTSAAPNADEQKAREKRTSRMEELCKEHNIEVKDALIFFDQAGFPSFADAHDGWINALTRNPKGLIDGILSMKEGKSK